jgi:hypothetical protein
VINKKLKDSIARSKEIPSSTHLPGNGARKEVDVYYTTYSCRLVLGLQAQSFVGQ